MNQQHKSAGTLHRGFMLVGILATCFPVHEVWASQQSVSLPRVSLPSPPDALQAACDMERSPLSFQVVASSVEHYPTLAERISGGWLIYDRYEDQVVELDDDLREAARWGRKGPGPLVDVTWRLDHAINVNDRLLLASTLGIHGTPLSVRDGEVSMAWSHDDLGITVYDDGQPPHFRLRNGGDGHLYAGATTQSAIWVLDEANAPRKVVQRCVPQAWQEVHRKAPVFESGPFKGLGYSMTTLADYTVLEGGRVLALGTLATNSDGHLSVELYDTSGEQFRAWQLPLGTSQAVFDPHNSRRLLVWGTHKGDKHVRLIEVDGEGYPSA